MRPNRVHYLREKIRTAGYCQKRMRYWHIKSKMIERLAASTNAYLDHASIIERLIRYEKKAEWYRKRDDEFLPIEEVEQVIELDLTESRLNEIAVNFYDAYDKVLSRRYAAAFIEAIFNVTIPDEWK